MQDHSAENVDLREQESSFRSTLSSIVGAASILIATLAACLLVPILPASVAVLLSVAAGALAYKVRPLAVMIMLAATVSGFVYQLGLPIVFIIPISIILFFASISGLQSGSILGIACGVIAAVLMVTPVYFLGILLLVAVPLFRARGRSVGSTAAVVVFVLLYVPLLVFRQNGTGAPLLFGQVAFSAKPPATSVSFNSIVSLLAAAVPSSPQAISQYMDKLNFFLPAFRQGDPLGGMLGLLLGVGVAAGIASAFGIMALLRWLERREAGGRFLPWIAPTASLSVGAIVFLIPLSAMQQPFVYQVVLGGGAIAGTLAGILMLGGVGGSIEHWLRQRDLLIRLQEEFGVLSRNLMSEVHELSNRVQQTKVDCQAIDLGHEELLARAIQEELAIVSQGTRHLSSDVLQEKVDLFERRREQLAKASVETVTKIRRYCENSRQRYKEYAVGFADLGYPIMLKTEGIPSIDFGTADLGSLLVSQRVLNEFYKKAAEAAMVSVQDTQTSLQRDLESQAGMTGIEIARNYLNQQNHSEVVDTLLTESINVNHVVTLSVSPLESRVSAIVGELHRIIRNVLVPSLEAVGDSAGASHYSRVLRSIGEMDWLNKAKGNLADKTIWITKTGELEDTTVSTLSDLRGRLNAFEHAITERAPAGYDWGSSSHLNVDLGAVSADNDKAAGQTSVLARVPQTEDALRVIENIGPLIVEYARIREFLINYINLEYLIDDLLLKRGELGEADLPVKRNYAQQYLRLYSENHPERTYLEARTGSLRIRN